MAAAALLAAVLLAATLGGLAERVCHPDAWHTRLDIRGPVPWRLVDYEAHNAAQKAFEEILPQVTDAIIRDGHLPEGAKLERQGLLPIEGCYRTAASAAGDQHAVGQYGFYLLAPFTHEGRQHVRRLGVWSTNKHTYPHLEVFRYRLYN